MNGRMVRKILMRGRVGTFYGARALFVVRVPLKAIPEPVPKFDPPPGKRSFFGLWKQENEDGTRTEFYISEVLSNFKPTSETTMWDGGGFTPIIHHAELVSSRIDEDGKVDEQWKWYEGVESLMGPQEDPAKPAPLLSRKNLPTDMVDAFVARHRWVQKYAHGSTPGQTGITWLDELHRAANYAKKFKPILRNPVMDLAYFVRWYNPRTKLQFCAQMSRALKSAKRAGVAVRVLRPPRRR